MTYYVDKETCIGCGLCTTICPEVFEMDADDLAKAIADPDEATKSAADEALESCPVGAIGKN
ncbi:MAG: ferredoxin [Clostridia bacterium]|nr:ferredoxin [Clostridia bacterium]